MIPYESKNEPKKLLGAVLKRIKELHEDIIHAPQSTSEERIEQLNNFRHLHFTVANGIIERHRGKRYQTIEDMLKGEGIKWKETTTDE